ncbi:ATP-dependent DNA helicase RuvA [Haematobacter missouriensis]|uniref:Holliday junction branch migration complex subunit RuvA n=1 Tax=Haematobacter missouriensis TaxID=366616 RepID=A0A212AUC1_9RHOB|nr:Holliday junction branch migration protein RuvA [Haematobacter missouriensis]KFI33404.1 ATP-dependent DNA helicase RuvA [Haematobacter missouriensis]OWJ77225.1 Holliday junction branch migration protein RuvA [Haematobacter missouriensis]OWJ85082.1 Holliday junction branch migration protein RuvA [Haematobacter missouriensis]
MIGRVAGLVVHRGQDHVVIDVRGVGYVVYVSDRTMAALPAVGGAAALWTELLVREDLLQLFGFPTLLEKEWHRLLLTVQGIGAKAALAILGTLGAEGLARAIALGDWTTVKAAPGVGPKIAQRVVNELKGKAPAVMALGAGPGPTVVAPPMAEEEGVVVDLPPPPPPSPSAAATAEALSALLNLGYGQGEAAAAVAEAAGRAPEAATPDLIRAALKLLAPKG